MVKEFLDVSCLLQKELDNKYRFKESKSSQKTMKSLIVLFIMHLIIRMMKEMMF
jgi:hypothetical protein